MRFALLCLFLVLAGAAPSSGHSQVLSDGFWISEGYENEPRLGPEQAKGVLIYNHGIQLGESFGGPLPPYVRLVQRDGWDIVRLNRKWAWDRHYDSTQALRDTGANLVASTLLETRTYLAGLVEMPRIPVPEANVADAA